MFVLLFHLEHYFMIIVLSVCITEPSEIWIIIRDAISLAIVAVKPVMNDIWRCYFKELRWWITPDVKDVCIINNPTSHTNLFQIFFLAYVVLLAIRVTWLVESAISYYVDVVVLDALKKIVRNRNVTLLNIFQSSKTINRVPIKCGTHAREIKIFKEKRMSFD